MLAERTDPLIGSMLGKDYHVLEPIGEGGMAVVYLVEHQTLLKRFAAKVLSPALASSLEARARFTQEAHASSQLDHENIVSITDFGVTQDQRPFFVMELLRGQTLDRRLADGPMSIEEIVAVSVPVARALAHAHAEGIVHLDVKPENIFLVQRSQGRLGVKVVDFGIAKTPHGPELTRPGEANGSPLYMAPETCRGDDDIDLRADVYSFGIVLYLMLCGRLPFVDDNLQRVLQMQLAELPVSPREVNAEITPELAAVVERALAKQRDDRYLSMEAMLRDFEAALPPGADRLLIEAQSGARVHDTPFAGAMAIGRQDSQRTPRASTPPPIAESSSSPGAALPSEASWSPPSTASASRPSPASASQPGVTSSRRMTVPQRRRVPIAVASVVAIASALLGVLIWRQLRTAPIASEVAGPDSPPTNLAVRPTTPVAAPLSGVAAVPPPSEGVAPPAAPVPPASDHLVAAAGEPEPATPDIAQPGAATAEPVPEPPKRESPVVAKRVAVRPKSASQREPSRPVNHAAVSAAAAVAPPPSAPAPQSPATEPVASAGTVPPPPADLGHAPTTGAEPPAPVKPAPPPPGTLDATPSIATLEVKGSLSSAIVRRSVERTLSSLQGCYRTAARAGGTTPAIDLQLTFEIDENRLAVNVAAGGASFGSLGSCATAVARQIRTKEAPDVGTAEVAVVIRFRPLL
jgi:eukaryotic-like serine/threonine-protein kinase